MPYLNEGGAVVKEAFFRFFAVLLIIPLLAASRGAAHHDPSSPPGFPGKPPPRASGGSQKAAIPPQKAGKVKPLQITFTLAQGWNIISFPFASVLETSGFTHKLLWYADGAYYIIDPDREAAKINTRWGYLAYSDKPCKARATGLPNNGEISSASFGSGWNLVGSPSLHPPPWDRLTATIGSTTHRLLDVCGPPGVKNYWISSKAFRFDGKLVPVELREGSNVRKPGIAFWFYAWHPLTITIAQDEKSTAYPEIKLVKPSTAKEGQMVTVSGSGFGNSPDTVCISGIQLADKYLKSWSSGQIVFSVPSYSVGGELVVYNDGRPSNAVELEIVEGASTIRGAALNGKVQDKSGSTVSGALVSLGNGLSTYTDGNGAFVFSRVPPGDQTIEVTRVGYKSAKGKVTIPEGGSKSVKLTLPAETRPVADTPPLAAAQEPSGAGKEQKIEKGTLYAVASAGTVEDRRWWPYRIDVEEWGNRNYSWHNTWYNDYGDSYYELKCPGARIGKTYNFKIEWHRKPDGKTYTNTWQRKMYKDYQKENFDHPW